EIDEEVRQIIDKSYHTAKRLLTDSRDKLGQIVGTLLEEETIEGEALMTLLTGGPAVVKTPPEGKKAEEAAAGKEGEAAKPPVSPPKPGLAWEAQSRLEPGAQ
ncbi:MAG: hypothetical protein HYY03_05905, partial [Chloroflexi bacterium]|nr:hypothetical protein [Chloroflexota bacterium]